MTLSKHVAAGDQRALARVITLIENDDPAAKALLRDLYERTGRAHVCGITGPPGAGKSTLVQRLAVSLRARGMQVAIVAVDPSSPFTGGALLGDRIRMGQALEDRSVFMRSLASRGHLGGLSVATADVITVLDAAGFDVVLVETVGAGQSDVEIMSLAHTTLVVMVPGLGDDVQAGKAGILEIADLFVVNKADRDGADRTANELTVMLDLNHMGQPGLNRWDGTRDGAAEGPAASGGGGSKVHLGQRYGCADPGNISWRPPVVKTVAYNDTGTEQLVERISEHRLFLAESKRWESRLRQDAEERLRQLVAALATRHLFEESRADGRLEELLQSVAARRIDPYSAAEQVLQDLD